MLREREGKQLIFFLQLFPPHCESVSQRFKKTKQNKVTLTDNHFIQQLAFNHEKYSKNKKADVKKADCLTNTQIPIASFLKGK